MRVIVGLTRAHAGTATISGRRYVDLPNPPLVDDSAVRVQSSCHVAQRGARGPQVPDGGAHRVEDFAGETSAGVLPVEQFLLGADVPVQRG